MQRKAILARALPAPVLATVVAASLTVSLAAPTAAQKKGDVEPDRGGVEAEGPAKALTR